MTATSTAAVIPAQRRPEPAPGGHLVDAEATACDDYVVRVDLTPLWPAIRAEMRQRAIRRDPGCGVLIVDASPAQAAAYAAAFDRLREPAACRITGCPHYDGHCPDHATSDDVEAWAER